MDMNHRNFMPKKQPTDLISSNISGPHSAMQQCKTRFKLSPNTTILYMWEGLKRELMSPPARVRVAVAPILQFKSV